MHFTTALIATALAASTGVAALSAIVPPANPSANGNTSSCYERSECLSIINNVRAEQEGLDPITLPSNWDSLSWAERLFTFMNLERTSRGLNPLTHLVNTYDSAINTAISTDADPEGPSALAYGGGWSSIWAGGSDLIPLSAMYGWMYYDGPGGYNEDCTSSDSSGCWGHRDAILSADMNKVDAGAGKDSSGSESMAALFWASSDTPAASDIVLAWSNETSDLA